MKAAIFFPSEYTLPPEYGVVPGFRSPNYAAELPLWVTRLGEGVDFVVYKGQDLSKYDVMYMSVMDVNVEQVKGVIDKYPKAYVYLGGYVDKSLFNGDRVIWMENVPFPDNPNYSMFMGVGCIPRLELSYGCKYKCAFCSVHKNLIERSYEAVIDEALEISENLNFNYVYIGDKTFGQADNYKWLPKLAKLFSLTRAFQGFIIQTTATNFNRLSPSFLEDSLVRYVEVGVESYNDDILAYYKKPHRTYDIQGSLDRMLTMESVMAVPNIVVGFPQETEATYNATIGLIQAYKPVISHLNLYNFSVYEQARDITKLPVAISEGDRMENSTEKSWGDVTEVYNKFQAINQSLLKYHYQ